MNVNMNMNIASKDDYFLQLTERAQYKLFPKGEPICHHGESGSFFNFVINGRADVYVPKGEKDIKREVDYRKQERERVKQLVLKREAIKQNKIYNT